MTLTDKVALVTGGSRGIGRGIALALAQAGALVTLTYRQQAAMAHEVAAQILHAGGQAYALPLTLQDPASIRSAIASVERQCGGVDILVNNAATSQEKPFERLTVEDWTSLLAVNLIGPALCCQAVLLGMEARHWGPWSTSRPSEGRSAAFCSHSMRQARGRSLR